MKYSSLYIWGPNPFNNRLLASHIESFVGATPICVCATEDLNEKFYDCRSMIFCDCDKTAAANYCKELHRPGYNLEGSPGITLMNVQPGLDLLDEIKAFGIRGIFYTTDNFELIGKGIQKVLDGEHWLSRDLLIRSLQSARNELRKGKTADVHCTLTLREQEILKMIVTGKDNQTIADQLFISPNTVKTHISNIYKKIDVSNRVQAIIWASTNSYQLSFYSKLPVQETKPNSPNSALQQV